MHFCTRNLIILLVRTHSKRNFHKAGVAKLVDAPDLGSGALGRVGSSPITRTKISKANKLKAFLAYIFLGLCR